LPTASNIAFIGVISYNNESLKRKTQNENSLQTGCTTNATAAKTHKKQAKHDQCEHNKSAIE
jgi:hypothetical protein